MDGQNYDSQDRASIAASRGKNQAQSEYKHSLTFRIHAMLS